MQSFAKFLNQAYNSTKPIHQVYFDSWKIGFGAEKALDLLNHIFFLSLHDKVHQQLFLKDLGLYKIISNF